MTVSPSPTNGIVHVSFEYPVDDGIETIEAYDMLGSHVDLEFRDVKDQSFPNTFEFDLSRYPSGLYTISIKTMSGKTISETIVKQ